MRPASILVLALALGLLAAPFHAHGQQSAKVYRIGVLTNAPPTDPGIGRLWEAFAEELL